MICTKPVPVFATATSSGLKRVWPYSDGYSIALDWEYAYSPDSDYIVGYNIYFSTARNDVFSEGVKYFTKKISSKISRFDPGELTYFAIKATLYNPLDMDPTQMKKADTATDAYYYPETLLSSDITDSALQIPVVDATDFPLTGIIVIGAELIKYYWVNYVTNIISTTPTGRGYLGTTAAEHTVSGYDGYIDRSPIIRFWTGFEDPNEIVMIGEAQFQPPNYAYTTADGYKQVIKDILTTDLSASDETNITNPHYDYTGYHQTSILDYFSGKCIGSYAGGEYGCADGYGNILRVRGLNIQTVAMQREEMQIETTGEPVVLLKRLWTGIRCNCFRYNNEAPEGRCQNCLGTGFVGGYEQYFNPRRSDRKIMLRVDPTTDDLKYVERGLEQNFMPTAWGLVVPTIKDRDVIIRFNEDRTDEFRYEVINVTRNKLLFSLSGAQKMQLHRLDRTDPAYQFRSIRDTSKFPQTIITTMANLDGIPHTHSIVINETITNVSQINETTSVAAGHSHPIISGVVTEVLSHSHTIIL